ncbi:2,5-diamino-6-ribosylamino-4(3H)-pyrimidinone 5'-phosphate reductase [Corynebacterium occultum]|uniref:2,5-diamino-6-ribosylamino-4(3H)-pyrimidinone 5'-phosphate reductase n=1 Tax=Corynebacterium occultum TaxID=2675219 RepID=A0A6B8WKE7_9CORY|nr:dihydrofolate reductase family protein [Corynebacterium occultum]QGU06908.1 2,5-diamino-6-ribosylamino-4(3H)-pyrimidinone 5'-phosphate reductase [Corynebacterium occultum]
MKILEFGAAVPDPLAPYLEVDRSRPQHECWVVGHMVAGLDGTAAIDGRVGSLSTRPDQELFRRMRQIADIVMVGAETVRREGYGLVKLSTEAQEKRVSLGQPPTPPVAVVSRSLDLDWTGSLFAEAPEHAPTHIITCAAADPARLAEAKKFATVIIAGEESVEPEAALSALAARGHRVVLCEGGPRWLGELVAADRLDELCLSVAPLMGGDLLPVSVTPEGAGIARFGLKGIMAEDSTLFLRYEVEG